MKLVKMEVNGKEITFVNSCRDTRNGFAHDSTMFVSGSAWANGTCHYINRTWERYTYQTVMRESVYNARRDRVARLKDLFRRDNNIGRIAGKRKAELEKILAGDAEIALYDAICANLDAKSY